MRNSLGNQTRMTIYIILILDLEVKVIQGHWPKNVYLGVIHLAINQEGQYTSF